MQLTEKQRKKNKAEEKTKENKAMFLKLYHCIIRQSWKQT